MSDDEPRRLGDALGAVSRELGLPQPARFGELVARWPELVGPALAAHARPRTLRDGVLTVAVDAPSWATELRYLEDQLVAGFAERVAPGLVRAVRVLVGGDVSSP